MITKYALIGVLALAVLDFSFRIAGYSTQEIYGPVMPHNWQRADK